MDADVNKLAKECIDILSKKVKNLKKLNIIIVGKSGVGKSTLINSLFRGNMAKTGLGRPVTDEIRLIQKKDYPLNIYDTPGFELSQKQQKSVKDEILKLIQEGYSSNDINSTIHCIWYCINTAGNRTFDETELEWLKDLTTANKNSKVPVIVVLTQAFPKKKAREMKSLVEKENLAISKVVPVLAQDMEIDDDYIALSYGLDTLVNVMSEVLPTELQDTLQNIQKVNLESKKKYSQMAVTTAVAAAAGEGAAPIPFSDFILLAPTQLSMLASIALAFGMDFSKSFLTTFISSVLGISGATIAGRTIAGNLLKLIPGIGSVAGGAISAATAGLLTAALGETFILLMEKIYLGEMSKEDINSKEGMDFVKKTFKDQIKLTKKKNK